MIGWRGRGRGDREGKRRKQERWGIEGRCGLCGRAGGGVSITR